MIMDILKGFMKRHQNTQTEEETDTAPPPTNSQQPWQFTHPSTEWGHPQVQSRQQTQSPRQPSTYPNGGQPLPGGHAGRPAATFAPSQGMARTGAPAGGRDPYLMRQRFPQYGGSGIQQIPQYRGAYMWGHPSIPSRRPQPSRLPGGRPLPVRPVAPMPEHRALYGRLPQRNPHRPSRQHPGPWY
ncbi:hypothetical protein ALPO108162_03830 [Alicyclobacillus pomorum]